MKSHMAGSRCEGTLALTTISTISEIMHTSSGAPVSVQSAGGCAQSRGSPPSAILVKGSERLEFGAVLAWVQTHLIPDSHCVTLDT